MRTDTVEYCIFSPLHVALIFPLR